MTNTTLTADRIQQLSNELNITRADLANALRGEAFLPSTCASLVDAEIYGDDPNFHTRWESRVKLTFDPSRVTLWTRAGVTMLDLQRLWRISEPRYAQDRITGKLWMTSEQYTALRTWLHERPEINSIVRSSIIVSETQYRLLKPAIRVQPRKDPLLMQEG